MAAFPAMTFSGATRRGILDCTEGWYAPEMPYSIKSITKIKVTRFTLPCSMVNISTSADVKKSRTTMILRLFTLSAIRPPIGDMTASGRNANPLTIPNSLGEPVTLSR